MASVSSPTSGRGGRDVVAHCDVVVVGRCVVVVGRCVVIVIGRRVVVVGGKVVTAGVWPVHVFFWIVAENAVHGFQ